MRQNATPAHTHLCPTATTHWNAPPPTQHTACTSLVTQAFVCRLLLLLLVQPTSHPRQLLPTPSRRAPQLSGGVHPHMGIAHLSGCPLCLPPLPWGVPHFHPAIAPTFRAGTPCGHGMHSVACPGSRIHVVAGATASSRARACPHMHVHASPFPLSCPPLAQIPIPLTPILRAECPPFPVQCPVTSEMRHAGMRVAQG